MGLSICNLEYNACLKIAPSNVDISMMGYQLSPSETELLGLLFCLRGLREGKTFSPQDKRAELPGLVGLIKQVKAFAKENAARNIIVVSKKFHLIFFARQGKIQLEMTDNVGLGRLSPGVKDGQKLQAGDHQTPEGEYEIVSSHPSKKFYYFMGISYPTKTQAAVGQAMGVITKEQEKAIARAQAQHKLPPHTKLGNEVGLHGPSRAKNPPCYTAREDWTWGCIAIEHYLLMKYKKQAKDGTLIKILP